MKSKRLFLLPLITLLAPCLVIAQSITTLTVCDGNASNACIPVNGTYVDTQGSTCEFIIPANTEGMDEMVGGTISKMTFHLSYQASSAWVGAVFNVYLAEVGYTTLNGVTGPNGCSIVYTGPLDGSNETMEIVFSSSYLYQGGNLLVGTYVQTPSNTWFTASFRGLTASQASYWHCNNLNNSHDFIPKTTFTYTPAPGFCEKPQNLLLTWNYNPSTGYTIPGLQWDEIGSNALFNVQYKKNSDTEWTIKEANYNGTSIVLDGLVPATDYVARVQHICDANHTSGWAYEYFTTTCDGIDITTNIYEEDFNSYYTTTTSTANPTDYPNDVLPNCWRFLNRNENPSGFPRVFLTSYIEYSVTGNCLFFISSNTTPLYAILPEFESSTSGMRLTFTYRNESTHYLNGTLHVGYMTNPTDATTYHNLYDYSITSTKTTKTEDITNIPEDCFIVFKYEGSSESNYYLSIDNVSVEEIPSCMPPTGLQIQNNSLTAQTVTFEWNSTSGDNFQYALIEGHNIDPQNVNYSSSTISSNTYHYDNLSPNTDYTFFIRKWCNQDEQSEGSSIEFNTSCGAITAFPWTEDFEGYTSGVPFEDPCWVNEHISGGGTKLFDVQSSSYGNNSTKKLRLPDQSAGTLTKLRLPEMTLPNNNYEFSIDVYRSSSQLTKIDGIRVFASTNGEIEGATELAFIPRPYTVGNDIIPAEAIGDSWYTYKLPIGFSGTCYIILRGENQYGASTFMDNFMVKEVSNSFPPINTLALGWNWWAPMVETSMEALNAALGNYVEQIELEEGEPGINVIPGEMYRILTNEACEFALVGDTTTTIEVSIAPGHNWFGYSASTSVSITEVFNDQFSPTIGDKIISQEEGFTIFNGTTWEGTLTMLVPGNGYVYISNSTVTKPLVFE